MTVDFLVIFLRRVRGVTELSSVILWPQVEKLAKEFDDFYVRMDAFDTSLTRLEEKDAYYQTVGLLRGIVPERHSVKILSHGAGAVSSYYIPRVGLDAQIREGIKEQSMILLHGLGGIGKTQTCFYIYRQYVQGRWNDGIDFICYLAFDGDEDQAVYQWVKIKKTNDFKTDTEFAWGVLENAADQGRLLVLIDDIRHHRGMGGSAKVKLDKIMALHCAVIFFSREDEMDGFQPMHVENLPEEACIKLFMDITGKVPDENEQKELFL